MNALSIFFPGVWVHEWAHAAGCYACGVKVHKITVKSNAGMVMHDKSSVRSALLIGLAPLLAGGILSFFLFGVAKDVWAQDWVWSAAFFWLAFSIGFHSIPSEQDMRNIPDAVGRRWGELWRSERGLPVKLGKSGVYVGAGILGWVLVGLAVLVNATLLVRLVWATGLGAIA